ncbi:hypothetical protein Dimus_019230 [Dionaea muscipula]
MAMASSSATKVYSFFLFYLLIVFIFLSSSIAVSGFQFDVGGHRGWVKPTGDERETYNEWAGQNRFHIGDTLYFKYHKDSVLEVSEEDYEKCNKSNPITRFDDGNTVFRFNHSKFFYFISGEPGHCEDGQRLIVRVMVQSRFHSISITPAPSPSLASSSGYGGGGGNDDDAGDTSYLSPSLAFSSSSAELLLPPLASYVMSAVAAAVAVVSFASVHELGS